MKFPPGFLHGEITKARRVQGLILACATYTPGLRVAAHAHGNARFVAVLRGEFRETYEQKTRTCSRGTLIFRPPGEVHSDRFADTGAQLLCVDISAEWMARAREEAVVIDDSADFRGGLLGHLASRLNGEFDLRDEVSPLAIESILLGIVAEASRRRARATVEQRAPRWLEQVREILHARYAEPLTLAGVAATVGVHPVHLARVFRQRYHCSPGDYVRQLRMEYVCREVSGSDTPLSEIALAAGFCDQSHFSRDFKRRTGMTPGEYRAASRSR